MADKYAGLPEDVVRELDPKRFLKPKKTPEAAGTTADEMLDQLLPTLEEQQNKRNRLDMLSIFQTESHLDPSDKIKLPQLNEQARALLIDWIKGNANLHDFRLTSKDALFLLDLQEKFPGLSSLDELDGQDQQTFEVLQKKLAFFLLKEQKKDEDDEKVIAVKKRIEGIETKQLPKELFRTVMTFAMGWGLFGDRDFPDKNQEVARTLRKLSAVLDTIYNSETVTDPTDDQKKQLAKAFRNLKAMVLHSYGEKRGLATLNTIATFPDIEKMLE